MGDVKEDHKMVSRRDLLIWLIGKFWLLQTSPFYWLRNYSILFLPLILSLLFIHHHFGIHQVRTLVFDNYQTCLLPLKQLDTFWTEHKLKVPRFTNNLQGLQKVMVKDFVWNIIPWNALLFEKTLKQLSILDIENNGFILNTCHDTSKPAETRVGFPVILSRLRWLIEPKFSQVCYFIYKLHEVLAFGQYCYPMLCNCFKVRPAFHPQHSRQSSRRQMQYIDRHTHRPARILALKPFINVIQWHFTLVNQTEYICIWLLYSIHWYPLHIRQPTDFMHALCLILRSWSAELQIIQETYRLALL